MTELLQPSRGAKVLEVGTGSGYQAAILAEVGAEVYSIEILAPLAKESVDRLRRLGYNKVHVKQGDGYLGWPEHAHEGVHVGAPGESEWMSHRRDASLPGSRALENAMAMPCWSVRTTVPRATTRRPGSPSTSRMATPQ